MKGFYKHSLIWILLAILGALLLFIVIFSFAHLNLLSKESLLVFILLAFGISIIGIMRALILAFSEKKATETILESLVEGVIAVDNKRKIIFVNSMAEKLLNMKKEDLLSKEISSTLEPELEQLIRDAYTSQEPLSELIIPKGRPRRYVDATAAPKAKDGGIILTLQDNTGWHKAIELGKDFIANAAHELKTPITIIRGFAETLRDHPEISKEMIHEITVKMVNNCFRMDTLIKNLLTLAALDEGIPQSRLTQVDLFDLVQTAKHTINTVHPQAKIEIIAKNPPLRMQGDSDLLLQAFLNLLDNAVKYSKAPADINVSLERKGNIVEIEISDKGIGIPEEELERIFERFYAVDKSHSRALGGSGLGLSIVERIIDRHQGKINVTSQIGAGSTFTLLLPIKV